MRVLIKHDEIVEMCKRIGAEITQDYAGKEPLVVCVLKGSLPFHAELIKHIELPLEIDFIQASSYNGGTETSGVVTIKKDLDCNIEGRDVILVEDIVDSGYTLSLLTKELSKRNPKSLRVVSMLDKPSNRRVEFEADYVGKTIDNLFVIGFGLDLDEKYRNLQDIFVYNED
jgi:hypoxanthine phosphoribosyltransferase